MQIIAIFSSNAKFKIYYTKLRCFDNKSHTHRDMIGLNIVE